MRIFKAIIAILLFLFSIGCFSSSCRSSKEADLYNQDYSLYGYAKTKESKDTQYVFIAMGIVSAVGGLFLLGKAIAGPPPPQHIPQKPQTTEEKE